MIAAATLPTRSATRAATWPASRGPHSRIGSPPSADAMSSTEVAAELVGVRRVDRDDLDGDTHVLRRRELS